MPAMGLKKRYLVYKFYFPSEYFIRIMSGIKHKKRSDA